MELSIWVNSTEYTDSVLIDHTRISKELSGRVSTAQVSFVSGAGQSLYDEALYDQAVYGVDAQELAEIELKDADTGVTQFAGYISRTRRTQLGDESPDEVQIDCDCNDWTIILERTVVPAATFTGQTDRAIIQSLIGSYAPKLTALTANIASTTTVPYFEVKEKTLRQALDELKELTGNEYYIDYGKNLHWFPEGTFTAPFDLSTVRNEYRIDEWTKDAISPINRAIVLGGILAGGTEIRVQYDDPVSQSLYGIHETTVVDRDITLASTALLKAQALVEANAYPLESGTLVTWKDGLDIGQSLDLFHEQFGVSGTYLIRSMELSWLDTGTTQYTIEFGKPKPKVETLLRQLEARSRQSTAIPTAIPVDGTVTDDSIAGVLSADVIGSVNAGSIIGTISAGQIGSVNASAILGQITAGQISTVNATTIQGVITAGQIGSVNATVIQGVIVTAQVADDLISNLRLYSNALRPIPRLLSDPTLPSAEWQEGDTFYNTTLGVFRRVTGGAWSTVTETSAVSGKLEYWHVGTIKAGSIIGLIAAGQIDNITASQITGQVSASQISGVNASAIVGSITASQISTVNASAIQGSISASQIGSVNASSIIGTITSSQIATVSASSITGSITSTQIGSINAATITIGSIQNSQIASVSASKLTAGTIDASVITVTNINASNITTGTLNANKVTAGTFSGTGTASITFGAFGVSISGSFVSLSVGTSALSSVSLAISGTQVLGAQKAGISNPSADVFSLQSAVISIINTMEQHGLIAAI